jgi:YesN/AraC family two-component response regulator
MKNLSILIAEDDVFLREELVNYISIFVDDIYQANNGIEAFDMYQKYKPSIILTDIDMPLLNGLELIEKIREVDENIDIIIISAYTYTEYLLRAIELNLVSYLAKPIQRNKLEDTLLKSIAIAKSRPERYKNKTI